MNIFKGKDKNTASSTNMEELLQRVEIAFHQLTAAVSKAHGHHAATSSDLRKTSEKRSFLFTQIWTLAASFAVITLIPLLVLRNQYPWAIFAAVCVGVVFILALDVLTSLKEQHRFRAYSKDLQGPPLDLTHRDAIDITMHYQVKFWSAHFDITPEELRETVKFVGPEVENVRNYLEYKKKIAASPRAEPQ